jgi:hypothetical protein
LPPRADFTPRALRTLAIDAKLVVPAAWICPDYRQDGLGEFVCCRDLDCSPAGAGRTQIVRVAEPYPTRLFR